MLGKRTGRNFHGPTGGEGARLEGVRDRLTARMIVEDQERTLNLGGMLLQLL